MNKSEKHVIRSLIYVMQASDEGFTTQEIRCEVRFKKQELSRLETNMFE